MSLVQEGKKEVGLWSLRKTAYELLALELDLVGTRRCGTLVVEQHGEAPTADAGQACADRSTSRRRPDAADQSVRKNCTNALSMSAPHSRRRLVMFLEVSSFVERWQAL